MSNRLSDPCESPGHLDLKLTNRHSGLPPVHTAKHSPSRSIRHGSAPSYTYMMGEDSTPDFLQSLVPSKSLQLDAEILPRINESRGWMMQSLRAVWMPALLALLTRRSAEKSSSPKLGIAREKGDDEAAWDAAGNQLRDLRDALREKDGVFPDESGELCGIWAS